MRNWKKITAGALSICLLANGVPGLTEIGGRMQAPAIIHAETKDVVVTGSCGRNATWNYNRTTKVMTITGKGTTGNDDDYDYYDDFVVGRYKKDVKKLVFSDGITDIGNHSFENFTALEEIQFGGVEVIGDFAFRGCTSLKNLTLAEKLEVVGGKAFSNCKNLTTVTVGPKLKTAYWDIFEGCENLTSIEIDKNNTHLYTDGKELLNAKISGTCGENVKYTYNQNTKTLTLSGSGAMFDADIDYCYGDGEELYCNFLTNSPYKKVIKQQMENLVVGDKVTSIGWYAFADCKGLKSVKLGKKVRTIGLDAFSNCTALQNVKLGRSTKVIGYAAFLGCSKLKKVSSLTGLTKVGGSAFCSCKNLKSFAIGKSLRSIGDEAFFDCASLTQISVDKKNKYFSKRGNMLLNKSRSKIVSACFGANKTCTIYGSVKSVNESVLTDPQIKKYSVSKSNALYSSKDGLLYSKDGKTLYLCPAKKTGVVNIDDTVISVKGVEYHQPFEGCESISQINLGKNVKELYLGWGTTAKLAKITISPKNEYYYESNGAVISKKTEELEYCYKTEGDTYTVPDSVKKIGDFSFVGQSALKKIVLSDSVTEIEAKAFWDAWDGEDDALNIESIYLGKNYVDSSNSFRWAGNSKKLKEILVSDENENYSSLDGCLYDKEMKTLLVCPWAVEIYKMPDTIVSFNKDFDSDKAAGIYAHFKFNIKELYSNDTITDLTDWIERIDNLQTLYIGKNVLTIKNIFYLQNLSKILVSSENSNFKSIDDMLYSKDGSNFICCPSQKEGKVVLEEGVTTISENAFCGCAQITDIVIPDTVTKVEKNSLDFYLGTVVIWVPAGKGEYYKSLFTKETGFTSNMLIMELEQ